MSNKFIKYGKLYRILEESIDWNKAKSYSLKLNQRTEFQLDGINAGMMIEKFDERYKDKLRKGSILYNNFNPNTYFNFGFDIYGETNQQLKTDYRFLAKILGIVVKSLFEWIKQNNPEVITVFSDADNEREKKKKLSIYGSILQGNEDELRRMGYTFGGNMGSEFLTIKKYNKNEREKTLGK